MFNFKKNKPVSSFADEELIRKYQSTGDKEVIGILFKRYTHLVFTLCIKYLNDKDDSQDAVMQVFEKIIYDLRKTEISNFKSWLYSVAKNHCLMILRKKKSITRVMDDFFMNSMKNVMELEEDLHQKEDEQQVNNLVEAIKKLNKEQKTCIDVKFHKVVYENLIH